MQMEDISARIDQSALKWSGQVDQYVNVKMIAFKFHSVARLTDSDHFSDRITGFSIQMTVSTVKVEVSWVR